MALTEQQIKIIGDFPLDNKLRLSRDQFLDNEDLRQEDIASLLIALIGSTAAFNLTSPDLNGNVAGKLFSILQIVQGGSVSLNKFRPLVRHVVDNSLDTIIWTAVFSLINDVYPTTPPSTINPTYTGTPITTSSNRLADNELCALVEQEVFAEIQNCTFRNVGGFWDKYFEPSNWSEEQKAMLKEVMTAHNGERWTDFPTTANEQPVRGWFRSLEERFLADAPHKLHSTRTARQFEEHVGQVDFFFQKSATESNGTSLYKYKNVLVVGELKKSHDPGKFKANLLQLFRYVRNVFADQPTRRFVHAFSLCGSTMELWIIDRSGAYSSGLFDIHEEQDKFARAFIGYATMDDDAMGLDTFIERERENGHPYVILDGANGNATKIGLDKVMCRQQAIVCRATTCFRTQNNYVAKFSWVSDKRKLEVDQLKVAEARGVEGLVRVVAHRQITTIAEMRAGLEFPQPHMFKDEIDHSGQPKSVTLSTNTASSKKRKSSLDHTSDNASASKRRQSIKERSKLALELKDQVSNDKDKAPSLYTPSKELWDNRIYSCLVVSPAGRVISDFTTTEELLGSLRDAIKAHQSLYVTGNILHRDISSNNIIITNPQTDGFRGMLIDLDLAKMRDSGPSGARHQTGTIQFMAVEVLLKVDHTYRHDLESFFYVLLWMCARQSWHNGFAGNQRPPQQSVLRPWLIGNFSAIARIKRGDMHSDCFEPIISDFPSTLNAVKPLCLKVRKILFPTVDNDGRMFCGTPAGDPDQLYAPIIAAFDAAIKDL